MTEQRNHAAGVLDAPARANLSRSASSTSQIAQSMLEEFEHELGTTRKFLERIPPDRLSWRPHQKSMTAGQLALHIAQTPLGVLTLTLSDQATAPNAGGERPQPASMREVHDALDQGAEFVRQTLPTIDDDRMRSTFTVVQPGTGRTLLSLPRADFLRAILLNHWYHHRGQLGVYLRLLGAVVPPSYGPSGDESPFDNA